MSDLNSGGPAFPIPEGRSYEGIHAGMTLRQYAAIKLRVPNSGTDWLDAMIRESVRDYFAAKAMQGLCGNEDWLNKAAENTGDVLRCCAFAAYEMADAMLKAREVRS